MFKLLIFYRHCIIGCFFVVYSTFAYALCTLGIENKAALLALQNPQEHYGLVTNQTGRTADGRRTVDVLCAQGFCVQAVFVPEHGFSGTELAEKKIENGVDQKTAIPLISLYKNSGANKIGEDTFANIDTIFFDMQDSGMRHYTYISTLYRVLESAAACKKKVIVLDRPNPLGAVMEGPLVEPEQLSFISIAPIPVRHGMTMGEIAHYFNHYFFEKSVALTVVPLLDYNRAFGLNSRFLAPLSPNITNLQSMYGYSFLGLLSEIKPFDMAVGTRDAFRCLLLPDSYGISNKQWIALSLMLSKQGLESEAYRYFSGTRKQWCSGLRFKISHIDRLSTMHTIKTVINFFKKEQLPFGFKKIDKAMGTAQFRAYVQGDLAYQELQKNIKSDLLQFFEKAKPLFLYKPEPRIVFG
jgi:uncharacterized protein YbbC (DUF1343 family)